MLHVSTTEVDEGCVVAGGTRLLLLMGDSLSSSLPLPDGPAAGGPAAGGPAAGGPAAGGPAAGALPKRMQCRSYKKIRME